MSYEHMGVRGRLCQERIVEGEVLRQDVRK